ncbi:hypothetical protein Patl1_02039 [Pistacia atlantica]|uniref:Uncharacterized protein n=1 Tax=Pistacia atlantica TaxID=434234 RepID=A0ACC1CBA0_9ROSI|nr:hypothetical protein Patl1_02039 [Pistacia atlantica]
MPLIAPILHLLNLFQTDVFSNIRFVGSALCKSYSEIASTFAGLASQRCFSHTVRSSCLFYRAFLSKQAIILLSWGEHCERLGTASADHMAVCCVDYQFNTEPIGVQDGSFAWNYLINELNIAESRLLVLKSQEDYSRVLQLGPKGGGVAAIVDELPYVESFLSRGQLCIPDSGAGVYKKRMGICIYIACSAFQRDSPLAIDLSTTILQLSENGDLQKIHNKWMTYNQCSIQLSDDDDSSGQLSLKSFWGLFLICGIACVLALIMFFYRVCCQYRRFSPDGEENVEVEEIEPARRRRTLHSSSFKDMIDFIDRKEAEIKEILKRKNSDNKQHASQSSDGHSNVNSPA